MDENSSLKQSGGKKDAFKTIPEEICEFYEATGLYSCKCVQDKGHKL